MTTKKTGKPKEDTAAQLTARMDALEASFGDLEARVTALESRDVPDASAGPAPPTDDVALTERVERLEHRVFNELSQ
jgi:hypothetical protein